MTSTPPFKSSMMMRMMTIILVICCLNSMKVEGMSEREKEGLITLQQLLHNPPAWASSSGPSCEWVGVACLAGTEANEQPGVVGLNLTTAVTTDTTFYNNHFAGRVIGPLPSGLFDNNGTTFPLLATLSLAKLHLNGSLALKLPLLSRLDVSSNRFKSRVQAADVWLPALRQLTMNDYWQWEGFSSHSDLDQPSPLFCGSPLLEELVARTNIFKGNFADCLWSLTNLKVLDLAYNDLKDEVPAQISQLTNLKVLDLSRNDETLYLNAAAYVTANSNAQLTTYRFSCSPSGFPIALSALPKLEVIEAIGLPSATNSCWSDNPCLPSSFPSSFPQLRHLRIDSVPCSTARIPSGLTDIPNLERLELVNIPIEGPLPNSLGSMAHLTYLDLSHTDLRAGHDFPNAMCSTTASKLQVLKVDSIDRSQEASLPQSWTRCRQLQVLSAQNNALSGSIPQAYCALTNLLSVDLSGNHLWGSFEPFTCAQGMQSFDLSGNMLNQSIPDTIGNWRNLTSLALELNGLTGTIPASIGQLTRLDKLQLSGLQLSGTIPDAIGDMTSLVSLELDANSLEGLLPSSITRLTRLQRLTADFNALGPSLNNVDWSALTSLVTIELTNNVFSTGLEDGSPFVTALPNFSVVSLDDNLFSTPFSWQLLLDSPSLSEQSSLRSFASNSISGTVPPPPEDMVVYSYSSFDLSYNALTGELPPEICQITTGQYGLRFFFDGNDLSESPLPSCCDESFECFVLNPASTSPTSSTPTTTTSTSTTTPASETSTTTTATLSTETSTPPTSTTTTTTTTPHSTTTRSTTTTTPRSTTTRSLRTTTTTSTTTPSTTTTTTTTTTTSTTTTTTTTTTAASSNTGMVVGVVIAVLIVLAILVWLFYNWYRYRQSSQDIQALDPVMRAICLRFQKPAQEYSAVATDPGFDDTNDDEEL